MSIEEDNLNRRKSVVFRWAVAVNLVVSFGIVAGVEARPTKLEELPTLPSETVIKTTAQQDACGSNTSGKVPYILKSNGKEYSVSCAGHNPL